MYGLIPPCEFPFPSCKCTWAGNDELVSLSPVAADVVDKPKWESEDSCQSYHLETPRITASNNIHASAATQWDEHRSLRDGSALMVIPSSCGKASNATAWYNGARSSCIPGPFVQRSLDYVLNAHTLAIANWRALNRRQKQYISELQLNILSAEIRNIWEPWLKFSSATEETWTRERDGDTYVRSTSCNMVLRSSTEANQSIQGF